MKLITALYGDPNYLAQGFDLGVLKGGGVLVLFSLGFEPASLAPVASRAPAGVSAFLADCYGVLGWSPDVGRNVELMEAGRGQEYGGTGGDGGRGVLAIAFAGEDAVPATKRLPLKGATSHMVVAAHGSNVRTFLDEQATTPYWGGIAKATYQFDRNAGTFEPVPRFAVSTLSGSGTSVGLTSFTERAEPALHELLDRTPAGARVQAVGMFPCFMRGKNQYGKNHVEPEIVSDILPRRPVFGMFSHGELGPKSCLGFDSGADPRDACAQHSMTTIVAALT